jgi:TatD DNase family protein
MLVDSHCHLNFPELAGDIENVVAHMRENGVTHALCVSITLEEFPQVLALAERYANIFASVGIHPDSEGVREADPAELVRLAAHPRVVAIGETGLDYYRLTGDLEWQRERFRRHVRAARACNKPLIVHTRNAAADTIRIMREEGADRVGGVMHCFTEGADTAAAALELGFYISFSGIVTFRNARALKEVVRQVPLERMLVETDSPYLAPVPHRGKVNRPGYVRHVAEEVGRLLDLPWAEVARVTSQNFFKLFKCQENENQAIH